MRSFDDYTPFYAVIGDPIAQSMSPDIHNACLNQLGIDAQYEAIQVSEEHLQEQVELLVKSGCKGFNVTIPHKLGIIDYLDEIDPYAKAIGAVNTVEIKEGRLKGYNTDGPGFFQGLSNVYERDLIDADVLVIGAGGAARAIVKTLLMNGVSKVSVVNRTVLKAYGLLEGSKGSAYTFSEIEGNLSIYDIIVNTTPIGMYPEIGNLPLNTDSLQPHTTLIDIIYNPLMTEFLSQGKEKGCVVQNGVPMFVYQAALAFKQWTGLDPDIALMEEIIKKKLGGNPSC